MKHLKAGLMISAVSLLAACAGQDVKQQETSFVEHCEFQPSVQAPEWYCNPEMEGGIAATGSAQANPANDANLQRTMAMASARDALARQMETKVENMLTDWARTTGGGEAQTYEKNFETVSRQVSQQTVSNTRQLKRWLAPDGTLVLLVGMDKPSEAVKEAINTSMNNQQALWQQFQSKQALEELDKRIDQGFD